MSWLDNYSTTNTFRSMYINGFIDISGGRLQTRSVTDGHLFIAGDTSLNGNLYVGGDISWNPNNLADNSIPSSAIIGGVGGSGLNTDADVTLNKRLFVSGDVSLSQSLIVAGDTLLGGIYNKLISSVPQTTFGSNETTTQLLSIGGFFIYNQPTTNGSTATIHNNSDSHIGESVAISDDGTIVAIAAPGGKFHSYNRLGYVEIRQYNGSGWSRIGLLIGNNTLTNPRFGRCIALNGDGTILATYAQETVNTVVSSVVKVYQYSAGSWSQLGSDIADGNRPGYTHDQLSFNTTGTILAIGDGNDNTVRIYEYSSGSWSQLGSDIVGEASDDALSKVSLNSSGSIIAVGAELNDGNGSNSGHVRVYQYSAGSWSQLGGDIDGEAANDRAGVSVSIDATGTIVAIGAYGNDEAGNSAGHIRVYQYDANKIDADTDQSSATFGPIGWNRLGTDIDGSNASDGFGRTVSLNSSGDTLAVGARNANNQYGYVRMYHYSSGSWTQVGTQQNGTGYQDFAGRTVAISKNNTIIVYGACDDSYDRTDVGSAKVYQVSKTQLVYDSNGVLQTDDTYGIAHGLVGIGITNPSYEVDISGTMQISGDISLNSRLLVGEFINTTNFYNVNSLLMPYYLVEWTNPSVGNIDTLYHDFRELFKAGKLHTNIHSNQLSIEAGSGGISNASPDPDNYVAFKVYPGVWELNFELNETGVGSNVNANYVGFYLYHDNGSGTTMIHNSHGTSFTSSTTGYLKDFRYFTVPNGKSGWLRIFNSYSQDTRRMVVRNTGITIDSATNIIPTVHLKCIQLNNWDGTDSSLTGVDSMNSTSIVSDWNNQNAIDYNTATNVFVNQI